jgi:hypothetical protein
MSGAPIDARQNIPSAGKRTSMIVAATITGFSVLLFCAILLGVSERGNDFDQFRVAATIVGTGEKLYDWKSLREVALAQGANPVPFGRMPVFAAAFKPLTLLSNSAGRSVWFAVNLAAIIAFVMLWPFARKEHSLMVLMLSSPLLILLSCGQDTGLFLLFVTGGVLLLRSDRQFLAGLLLALCANKFHLAFSIPLFLIATRRWNAMWGGLCGGLVLFAISAVFEGWTWPVRLYALSALPEFSPAPYKMPNLNGLAYWLPFSVASEAILIALVLAATWFIARRYPLEIAAPVMVAAGLLVSHHAYLYDAILLVPGIVLVQHKEFPIFLKCWSVVVCFPYTYTFLLKPGTSMFAEVAITGFPLALLAVLVYRQFKTRAAIRNSVIGA